MKKILAVFSVLALMACGTDVNRNPILTIEGGQVQGVDTEIKGVTVYRGIPFAAPPIGENRWRAPQPVVPWEGVKVCDTFGHPPFQATHYPGGYTTEWGYGDEAPYSEDCLYLNVWTKASGQPEKKLPVAVWIFGGGMREGWGSEPEFDGKYWGDKDVVLVSFYYRVGPFGFFAHPLLSEGDPEHATGNWGTLDQIEAIKWVKRNIAQFGGDPDNIMIFGQSAGSRSVKFLSASPLTEGLYDKAVIMSGSGLQLPRQQAAAPAGAPAGRMPMMGMGMPQQGMTTLAEAEASTKEVCDWANLKTLRQLRGASTETIFALGTLYQNVTGKRSVLTSSPISPYIDGYVLPESFDDACLDGTLHNITYMIGFTLNDAGNMAGQISDFCLNREEMGGKAYAYQFARPLPDDGSHPEVRLRGAFHSSDLWFVFKSLEHCWRPWTQGDWDLSEKMLSAWSNFAKYGDPNGKDGGDWKPYTKENRQFMRFRLDENDVESSDLGDPLR
ncbi:MAG: carboxylesterase family protein [Bacteroidetes bacterium]|nr:carboxylesterase family protein [Candidatus Colenecus caballi]